MLDGSRTDGREPLSDREWFKWIGAAWGAAIAVGVGWFAVPNSLVPTDTPDAHLRLAGASVVAATPWAYRLARGAARRPARAAVLLFLGTYLLGMLTFGICGVPYELPPLGPGLGGPTSGAAYFEALVPWIAAGAVVWAFCIGSVGPVALSLRLARPASVAAAGRKWLPLAVAALVTIAVMLGVGGDVRHIGWRYPDPPAAHRPTAAGVVADYRKLGQTCRVTFDDGRSFDVTDDSCLVSGRRVVGELFLAGVAGGSWEVHLPPSGAPAPNGAACWALGDRTMAWDRGDAVLFKWLDNPPGLELPKAPGFTTKVAARPFFGDLVYEETIPCINRSGQVVFMDAPNYI
jgi:hypothetical protein